MKIFKFFHKRLDYVLGFTAGPALFAAILYSMEHFEAAFLAIAGILAVVVLSFPLLCCRLILQAKSKKEKNL